MVMGVIQIASITENKLKLNTKKKLYLKFMKVKLSKDMIS